MSDSITIVGIINLERQIMAIFKCKMCGGDLQVEEGMSVCECEYCGTRQTLPKVEYEQKLNSMNIANHFRHNC